MRYEKLKKIKAQEFRRLTGVKRQTFETMIDILKEAERKKMRRGGRPSKVSLEDRLLMSMEYWREYRTYFHIGSSYGISESNCFQAIKWIEDTLIKSKKFSLPGKKALLNNDSKYEVILIDATETPIERPKKNKSTIIQERRKDIP